MKMNTSAAFNDSIKSIESTRNCNKIADNKHFYLNTR